MTRQSGQAGGGAPRKRATRMQMTQAMVCIPVSVVACWKPRSVMRCLLQVTMDTDDATCSPGNVDW